MHRLLIVDDNPGDRELVIALLDEADRAFEVLEAGSLREARAMLGPPLDLAVLDVRLPDGSGAQIIPELRAASPFVAILVLSGMAHEREAIEAVRAGAYDYLKKDDLEPARLARTLRAALEHADAQRLLAAERSALARSEARFRAFVQSLPEPSWAATEDGVPRLVNARWEERFGPIKPWIDLVEPSARAAAQRAWQRALGERQRLELRLPLRSREGIRRHLVRVEPAEAPARDWYATLTDIEELEAARTQLERINRGKDNFMAILGHELRNPIGGLALGLEQLERDPSAQPQLLPMMHRQLAVARRITEDLHEAARYMSGQVKLQPESIPLSTLVHDAVAGTRTLLDARRVDVHLDLRPDIAVVGDAVRLTQVVSNLLANAAKHGHEGGNVWVTLDRSETHAELRVCDDGPGIDPALLPVIFEPFVQAPHDREHSHGGLGLGLAIARQLVRLHGGTIAALSRPGGGTVMSIQLPI